jgi:DNA-binding IclR family transcriptional regulator
MVYIESCRSSLAVALQLDVSSRIPIATTAMGRALLCALPQTERDFLLDHIRFLDEEIWPKIKAGIEQDYKDFQDFGFCVSVAERGGKI